MTARAATDKRPVSLTKRQWHLILSEWHFTRHDQHSYQFAGVMERAAPLIEAYCDEVKSPDDLVAIPASPSGWAVVVSLCWTTEALRWNVLDDIEKQLGTDSHGG